jgi:hypothetical protein
MHSAWTRRPPMKRWKVRWKFTGGYELERESFVLARDEMGAKEKIWRNHVEPSQLRKSIVYVSVEEVEGEGQEELRG